MPSQNVDVYSKEVNDGNKEKSVPSDVDCYQYSFSNMDPQDGMPLYKRKQGLQGKDQTKVLRGQGFVPTISLCAPVGLPTLALASHLPVTLSQHILFPSGSGLCHPYCHTWSMTEHMECFESITDEVGIGWKTGIRRLFFIWCPDDK